MEEDLLLDLRRLQAKFYRWMLVCLFFAIAVSAIALFGKSWSFDAMAAFLWFFTWNRWMEWRRTKPLLRRPETLGEDDLALWQRIAFHYFTRRPRWMKISNRIAVILAIVLVTCQFVLVESIGSRAVKLLYLFFGAVICLVLANAIYSRVEARTERRYYSALQGEFWRELT